MFQNIDIFLDLEGFGVGVPDFGEGARVNVLLERLPAVLEELGFNVRQIWGTACVWRKNARLPGRVQIAVKHILISHGGVMFWATEIADDALKKEVLKRLREDSLAPAVLLVANDHGFSALVQELKNSGRSVIVVGHQISKQLALLATTTIKVQELIGEDTKVFRTEPTLPFNGIQLSLKP